MRLVTDKRLPFAASVDEVWAAMCDVGSYQQWWPWLQTFEAEGLAVGEIWRCDIVAPLRYHVAFTLKFDVVVPATHIECSLRGDITGGAWIDLEERNEQSDVWIRSELAPASTFLRALTRVLYPVALAGHDAVINNGAKQFQERALRR
jgi:uncharacterized protein YndB with AHSA1/START domain